MKKNKMKKMLSCIFAIALLLTGTGCNNVEKATGRFLKQIEINNYENSSEFDSCFIGNRLGRVSANTDTTYVKKGNMSAQLTIIGDARYKKPFLYQTFDLQKKSDYRDFSKVILLTMWIYNANNEDKTCDLALSFEEGSMGTKTYDLKANAWTQVQHYITRENLPMQSCEGFYLYFEKALETPDIFYVDDVMLFQTDKEVERKEIYLSENEICSFDKLYQHSLLSVEGGGCASNDLLPKLTVSQEYTWRNGDFNLKVEAPKGSDTWQNGSDNWPGVEIHQSLIELIDWTKYDDDDVFCFDYYAPEENGLDYLWLSLYNNFEERFFASDVLTLKKGRWLTISFSVSELNSQWAFEEYTFNTTTQIVLRWGEFNDRDRVIYLDNFRMEVNANK